MSFTDNYDDSNSTDESKLVFVNKDDSVINKIGLISINDDFENIESFLSEKKGFY